MSHVPEALRFRGEQQDLEEIIGNLNAALLGSTVLCVMAVAAAATLRRKLPMPSLQPATQDAETSWTRIGR